MPDNNLPEADQPIRVSAVEYEHPVGKRLSLAPDGKTVLKESLLAARATDGRAMCLEFGTPEEAFRHRLEADPTTMYLAGTFEQAVSKARVVPEKRRSRSQSVRHESVIALTKDFLEFREGPGEISIDIDVKSPGEVAAMYPETGSPVIETAEDALDALYEVLPEARDHPVLVMPSSSSLIEREADGVQVKGPGGWRILLITKDASQTPRILRTIHTRCWARKTHHFAYVSKGGAFLARSLADQALARPTQPDYPTADLGDGLRKVPDTYVMKNLGADLFDPTSVELSFDDERAAQEHLQAARAKLKPDEDRAKNGLKTREVERLTARGLARSQAERAVVEKLDSGVLLGSETVTFEDGTVVDVATLLSGAGEEYDGQICLDPVEPEYDGGRPVGIFYWNDGEAPGVHSFAHGSRFFRMRHDGESVFSAIQSAEGDHHVVVHALALAELTEIEKKSAEREAARALGLGNSRQELRAEVARERARVYGLTSDEEVRDPSDLLAGPQTLDDALPMSSFPQIRIAASGPMSVVDHQANIAHLLEAYGIIYRYNVISKRMEWAHPEIPSVGDNAENNLFSHLIGLSELNRVPTKNLDTHLVGLGDTHAFNPVTDYLADLVWDDAPRIGKLVSELDPDDLQVAEIALRLFLVQACAAADHAEIARLMDDNFEAHFEYVLVLVGEQGAGKTKGFRRLLPRALRGYYREGQVLNLSDKDSVKRVLSTWIAELGELDATFKKSDVAHKKAFLSQSEDEIRAPYARKPSRYGRRTVFVGTVNDESFLVDETGNRRYLPISVGDVTINWSDEELDQLWAEAWHRYTSGERWWPTDEEAALLAANAERYRVRTEIEERVEKSFDWGQPPAENGGRWTASEIYRDVMPHDARPPNERDLKTVGACVKRQWLASGRTDARGGQLVIKNAAGELVSLNAPSGKNRGWLLPPRPACSAAASFALAAKLGARK